MSETNEDLKQRCDALYEERGRLTKERDDLLNILKRISCLDNEIHGTYEYRLGLSVAMAKDITYGWPTRGL